MHHSKVHAAANCKDRMKEVNYTWELLASGFSPIDYRHLGGPKSRASPGTCLQSVRSMSFGVRKGRESRLAVLVANFNLVRGWNSDEVIRDHWRPVMEGKWSSNWTTVGKPAAHHSRSSAIGASG